MTTLAYTVPTPGTDLNSIADPEIATALTSIKTWGNGNLDGANVAATLTGRRLALQAFWLIGSSVAANTLFTDSGGNTIVSGAAGVRGTNWVYLDPANFAVVGKTNTQLILRASLATNSTAPAMNFTMQLMAVTFGGATSGAVTPTAGSAVSGSAVTISAPTASSAAVAETAAFTFPAAGAYALAVVLSGATAANSGTNITIHLFALNS